MEKLPIAVLGDMIVSDDEAMHQIYFVASMDAHFDVRSKGEAMSVLSIRRWMMAAAVVVTALFSAHSHVMAAAPQIKTQVPGYYRMMLGQLEITALYDGYVEIEAGLLRNASSADIQKLLAKQFTAGEKIQTAVNTYLINTGEKLILVDTGAGHLFGPSLGFMKDNLKAAGYTPDQVDAVLVTHLHGDHVGGLINADGQAVFPRATIYVAKDEAAFWLAENALSDAPEAMKPYFQMAQSAVAPYKATGRLEVYEAGSNLFPEINSVVLPGHTPGHTGYLLQSDGQRLLIWGDIVHSAAVQFAKPGVAIEFDVDSRLAVKTREKLFTDVAEQKLLVAGMHLPFPGVGHVRRDTKGSYTWVPINFSPVR